MSRRAGTQRGPQCTGHTPGQTAGDQGHQLPFCERNKHNEAGGAKLVSNVRTKARLKHTS